MAESEGHVRSNIAAGVTGILGDQAEADKLVRELLSLKKKGRAEFVCKGCSQRQVQYAEFTDSKAVTEALKVLNAEGFGRPQGEEQGERIVFQRLVEMPVGDDA